MILASLAVLGATLVAFVLIPVFTAERSGRALAPSEREQAIRDLEEKKTRLYDSITDLDFEKAAGKVSEEDYARARDDYLTQVAEVMARLDGIAPEPEPEKSKKSAGEAKSSKTPSKAAAGSRACASCGASSPSEAKFCIGCGEALGPSCASCGAELPDGARFCPSCGEKRA